MIEMLYAYCEILGLGVVALGLTTLAIFLVCAIIAIAREAWRQWF